MATLTSLSACLPFAPSLFPAAAAAAACEKRPHQNQPDAERQPGVEVMRFGASLTFANKDVFRRAVIKVVEKSDKERRLAESNGNPPKVALQVQRSCNVVRMRRRVGTRMWSLSCWFG